MPRDLPAAPEEINAISRDAWENLRGKVDQETYYHPPLTRLDGPGGRRIGVRLPPDHRPGLIVCPPDGKGPLDPPMCWVQVARISNTQADPATALVTFEPWPPGSDYDVTVPAVNLGAYHCGDPEQFKPGTPVILEWGLDLGDPPARRFYFRIAEQAKCLPPCPPPSSSGSGGSSGGCCPCYQVKFTMDPTEAPTALNTSGPESFASADGNSFIQRNAATGNWILVYQPNEDPASQSIFTADGSSPCPPTDPTAWGKQSGDGTLFTIECCPPSGSSSGGSSGGSSAGSGGCVEVILAGTLSFTLNLETCEVTPSYQTVFVERCGTAPGRTFINGIAQ